MRAYTFTSSQSIEANAIAHARMGGPFGNRGSSESREQTIANGQYDSPSGNY